MESEKVKEIKKLIDCDKKQNEIGGIIVVNRRFLMEVLNLINELESENERLNECYKVKAYDKLRAENKQLKNRIAELEEGIAKSMLGCEFLTECTKEKEKEVAEKIWNIAKLTVDITKHIVQGREYLHLDALKEIIKSCGVEIKE